MAAAAIEGTPQASLAAGGAFADPPLAFDFDTQRPLLSLARHFAALTASCAHAADLPGEIGSDREADGGARMAEAGGGRVNSARVEALARSLRVAEFAEACDGITRLFSILGPAFSFAGKEYAEKVSDLVLAGREFGSLAGMMHADERSGTVRVKGSHTRNLLRVLRGLDLNRRLFRSLLKDSSQPLRVYALDAYTSVFSAHHPWPVRSLVAAGTYTLPHTHAFMGALGEDVDSWREAASAFTSSVSEVIVAVEHLFTDNGYGLDW